MADQIRDSHIVRLTVIEAAANLRESQLVRLATVAAGTEIRASQAARLVTVESVPILSTPALIASVSAGAVGFGAPVTAPRDLRGAMVYIVGMTYANTASLPVLTCTSGCSFAPMTSLTSAGTDFYSQVFVGFPDAPSAAEVFTASNIGGIPRTVITVMAFAGATGMIQYIVRISAAPATAVGMGVMTPPTTQLIVSTLGQGAGLATGVAISEGFTIAETIQANADHFGAACVYKLAPPTVHQPAWTWTTSSNGAVGYLVRLGSGLQGPVGGGGGGGISRGRVVNA